MMKTADCGNLSLTGRRCVRLHRHAGRHQDEEGMGWNGGVDVICALPFGPPAAGYAGVAGMKGRGRRVQSAELDALWPAWKSRATLPPLDDRTVEVAVRQRRLPKWVTHGVGTVRRFGGEAWMPDDRIPNCPDGYMVKPIWNPGGLGIDARHVSVLPDPAEIPGMMVQPFYSGTHASTDVAIRDGVVRWGIEAVGQPTAQPGLFRRWSITDDGITAVKVPLELHDFTGCLNVETIDDNVIEVHFRPSLELFPLYGDDAIEALLTGAEKPPVVKGGDLVVATDETQVVDLKALGEVSDRAFLAYFPDA